MEIIKYKKKHKKIFFLNNLTKFLGSIHYGYFGIKAASSGILTIKQVETVRRIFVRITKRTGKLFIRVYFQQPLTGKALMSRMGKGVGAVKTWISYIKKGAIFLELININEKLAIKFFKVISYRLSLKINFIIREIFKSQSIA